MAVDFAKMGGSKPLLYFISFYILSFTYPRCQRLFFFREREKEPRRSRRCGSLRSWRFCSARGQNWLDGGAASKTAASAPVISRTFDPVRLRLVASRLLLLLLLFFFFLYGRAYPGSSGPLSKKKKNTNTHKQDRFSLPGFTRQIISSRAAGFICPGVNTPAVNATSN